MTNHGRLVPSFIESASPTGLRRLMLKTNIKNGAQMQFFDIQTYKKRNKTYWIAWYFSPINSDETLELLDGKEV